MSSATPKDPEEPRKTTVVDDRRILSLVKKTPSQQLARSRNTLQEVGVCVSSQQSREDFHQSEYRGSPQDVNHWWASKTEGRFRVCQTTSKKAFTVLEQHPMDRWDQDQLVPEWWKRRVWRRKGTAHDPKHTTSSVKHGGGSVMAWACMPASGTGSLVFIDDVTADKSSRMNSEVFRAILSAHVQPNASELIGRRFTVQMDNDPKHTAKATKEFWRERSGLLCNGQVNHLTWIRLSMHFTCWDKTEGKMPQEQAGTEDGCSRGLAEHHQGWNPASGDVYAFQTSGCNWLQRICNQVLKSESLIHDYYSVPLLLVP